MPNHVYTILSLGGDKDQAEKFLADITNKDGELDFSLLLPCPPELLETTSPVRIVSKKEREEAVRQREEAKESGEPMPFELLSLPLTKELQTEYLERFGTDNWYDWMLGEYGTKWGMYSIENCGSLRVRYQTAWSPASQYYLTISEKYPMVEFLHEYVDEGYCFLGSETIKNGDVVAKEEFSEKGSAGKELICRLGLDQG